MKSKAQRFAESWIPVTKRLPPVSHEDILCWLPFSKIVMVHKSMDVYQAAIKMAEGDTKHPSWDKCLSHWMKVVPPPTNND